MNFLLTGGAGYIGSHTARRLSSEGYKVVVLDNLHTGVLGRLPSTIKFVRGDCNDSPLIENVVKSEQISCVMHFAALKQARESVSIPWQYWYKNIESIIGVLKALSHVRVDHFIQSSSCSIYGNASFVNENSPAAPESPYGWTKSVSEQILMSFVKEKNIPVTSLRYFNAIGCDTFPLSFDTSTESLLPSIFNRIINDKPILIFGNDHDTEDGTAVRDFLDVRDIAEAHALAALNTPQPGKYICLNVSSGIPLSVNTVIQTTLKYLKKKNYPIEFLSKKSGDPGSIWATPSKALNTWGWKPKFKLLDSISSHAHALRID